MKKYIVNSFDYEYYNVIVEGTNIKQLNIPVIYKV